MARIAVATFQHETNTFAPSPATMADFIAGGGWPGSCTGETVFERVAGTNIPIAGFVVSSSSTCGVCCRVCWRSTT